MLLIEAATRAAELHGTLDYFVERSSCMDMDFLNRSYVRDKSSLKPELLQPASTAVYWQGECGV